MERNIALFLRGGEKRRREEEERRGGGGRRVCVYSVYSDTHSTLVYSYICTYHELTWASVIRNDVFIHVHGNSCKYAQ